MANLIRLVPDELKAAMQLFTQRAEQLNGLHRQMESHLDRLRSGGWTGKGAESFYTEMQNFVSPALMRLIKALHDSTQSTQNLINVLQQAEEEAAMLFFGEGDIEEAGSGLGVAYIKNGGEMPVRYKLAGAGGGGGNREELDTLTGDQARSASEEFRSRFNGFNTHISGIANVILRFALPPPALIETGADLFSGDSIRSGIVSALVGMGAERLGLTSTTLIPSVLIWLSKQTLGNAVEGFLEFADNRLRGLPPVNLDNDRTTIPELAWVRARDFAIMMTGSLVGENSVLTHLNFLEISDAVDGALAGNPNAAISGEIYTNDRGETYARITADGQEIYNKPVTADAARAIDETFDRHGPNYTSHNSLAQGINSYMESNWSNGANIPETIRNIMNDPDMRTIVERINQGEAITPSEILPILERYPVVMPVPLPEAPIAPAQPEAIGTLGAPNQPPAITPEVTPGAPPTQTQPPQPTLTPTPPAP